MNKSSNKHQLESHHQMFKTTR